MSHAFAIVLLAASTCATTALAQDPSTATEMSTQCAANWNEHESVRCTVEVTTELPTDRTVADGECLFVGDRARVSVIDRNSGIGMLTVRGRRISWTEMRAPGDPPHVEVVKNFRGHFDYEHETLIGMVASTPILLHPSRIFGIVARNYDLEFGRKQVEANTLCVTLEGDLRPDCRAEDLGRQLSPDEQRIVEKLGRCRFTVRADDFLPAKAEFYSDDGHKPSYSIAFTNYRIDNPILESDLCYTPPEGATVRDLAAMHQARFRLVPSQQKHELPLADRDSFQEFNDETRIDVLVMPDGAFEVGGRKHGDFDGIYGALWWAATIFGRIQGGSTFPLADVDLVVYAAPDTELGALLTVLQACSTSTVCINRLHLAVRDRTSGDEGSLPFFLPTESGVRPGQGTAPGARPERFQVNLCLGGTGPEYRVATMSSGETSTFDSLDDLASVLEAIRDTYPRAHVAFALYAMVPSGDDSESRPVTVKHLADLLDLLASHGADLMRQQSGMFDEEIIEKLIPEEGK